ALVERGDEITDRRPGIGCRRQGEVAKAAVSTEYGVRSELVDVLGRSTKLPSRSNQAHVHPNGAE
ncbi:MAG: hypothetical protein ABIR12_01515, partial [Ilumatobacteraceae bacterium]